MVGDRCYTRFHFMRRVKHGYGSMEKTLGSGFAMSYNVLRDRPMYLASAFT
jgi:hypothetical protein